MAKLSLQQLNVRKTAVILNIQEDLVDLVIGYKSKEMHEALYDNKSAEDSGLGKFSIRTARVRTLIKKQEGLIKWCEDNLAKEDLTEKERNKFDKALLEHTEKKQYLENKL